MFRRKQNRGVHDLLYLSETKMQHLMPQLPGRVRKRLGLSAGLNVGVLSVSATLESAGTSPPITALNAVIRMIERQHGRRGLLDPDLREGDWIRFSTPFRYADTHSGKDVDPDAVGGLVFFASESRQLLLIGSASHIVDQRPPEETPRRTLALLYVNSLLRYAATLRKQPDRAATGDVPAVLEDLYSDAGRVMEQVGIVHNVLQIEGLPLMTLAGYARVLVLDDNPPSSRSVLATPLYVEYASRG
ncbi:SAVMC3_10250 family protein [Streptomyces sp. Qhu-G9]|uniref:SAVMC3_10250 family protein n=1 Tax=Streptomyces sp. Qhu-G9 TaxID=3452799 RepID=UPI0022AC1FA9|nr:SAVMC3_10250 family protein [Streptomyces aurantiacus]WAU82571.1 SAVMC3_10250 family protein [Streptomyces aurantiacus]